MDGILATTESANAAYQKMSQDLANAEENITILTKRVDDTLNAQAITSTSLEKANEEKKALQGEASARSSKVERLKEEASSTRARSLRLRLIWRPLQRRGQMLKGHMSTS
ncbi:hypothetical protein Adt_21012 [Abeliophyllum distichum]|uniref:Uncharacterized protein n=1 Tax=Abeliophyllum distichum TaxID=126358 RepID=A0ABD1SYD0_9LAMI